MGLQKHPHQYEMINMDEEEGEPLAPSSSAADANGDGRRRRDPPPRGSSSNRRLGIATDGRDGTDCYGACGGGGAAARRRCTTKRVAVFLCLAVLAAVYHLGRLDGRGRSETTGGGSQDQQQQQQLHQGGHAPDDLVS